MPTYRTENISPANERAALIEETAEGSNTYDAGACPKSGDAGAKWNQSINKKSKNFKETQNTILEDRNIRII